MSVNKQESHERVLAYQAATTLTYDEMEQVSGGSAGLYLTVYQSGAVAKLSGKEPKLHMDSNWDK